MSETLSHPSPAPESLPSTPEVDPETVAEIDSIEEPVDTRVTSKWAERLQRTADTVGTFLENRAINKAHKEALKEDHGRTVEAQNEAYDSYAENISVTKERESEERSHERREKAKTFFNKIGNSSLNFLESQGIIPLRGTWHKQKGMNFSAWVARKYVDAKQRRAERVAGFLSAEQNEAVTGEVETEPRADESAEVAPEPETSTPDAKETPADKPAETEPSTAEPDTEVLPESPDSEPTEEESSEEVESDHENEERARAAREKAEVRAEAAAERREKRRERVKNVTERAKGIVQKLKMGKIGKGALKLLGRAKASASAAMTAWSNFGKE